MTASTAVAATGTLRFTGGSLSMAFDREFSGLFEQFNIKASPISPALVSASGITFPVTGGVFQKATRTGEISLSGGIMLETETMTILLTSPMIAVDGADATLSFLVTADGRLLGRMALFDVNLPEKPFGGRPNLNQPLVVNDISLTLTASYSELLNQRLGVTMFSAGTSAGLADLAVTAVKASTTPIRTTPPK
jgi:hypothetical protein